jgi:hypothetical protein
MLDNLYLEAKLDRNHTVIVNRGSAHVVRWTYGSKVEKYGWWFPFSDDPDTIPIALSYSPPKSITVQFISRGSYWQSIGMLSRSMMSITFDGKTLLSLTAARKAEKMINESEHSAAIRWAMLAMERKNEPEIREATVKQGAILRAAADNSTEAWSAAREAKEEEKKRAIRSRRNKPSNQSESELPEKKPIRRIRLE